MEYQAHGRFVRDKMAKLRALRLAKEAAEKQAERTEKPATGKVK